MSSLSKDPHGKGYRLQFKCPKTDQRKTLRLGISDSKTAHAAQVRVERLIDCAAGAEEPDQETCKWLTKVSPQLTKRLAAVGLLGKGGGKPTTLGGFIEHFIAVRGGALVSTSTNNHYKQARDRALQFFTKDKPIGSITVGDAQAFSAWMKTKCGLGENTANCRCAKLRTMFQYAIDCELISKNPFADKSVGKRIKPATEDRRHFLKHEDAMKIMEVCKAEERWELAALFALCRWGGLRVGEGLALTSATVDFEKNRLTTLSPKTKSKGKERRTLPLFPEIKRALAILKEKEQAPKKGSRLFPSYKSSQAAKKVLLGVLERAGVKEWVRFWQNLRGTRATELADKYPSYLCAAWLGHTEDVASSNYRRPTEEHFSSATAFETAELTKVPIVQAEKPAELPGKTVENEPENPTHNPTQQPAVSAGNDPQQDLPEMKKPL